MIIEKKFTQIIERTAPSPTGGLHLGHVLSVTTAYQNAKKNFGLFKLRMEDIDFNRCRLHFEKEIITNLSWLGINWDGRIMRQRSRRKFYAAALKQLYNENLIYPCSCTRKDIKNAMSAPHSDKNSNMTYPGTCRKVSSNKPVKALRLNISKATKHLNIKNLRFFETGISNDNSLSEHEISTDSLENKFGDFVVARSDIGTSYNLAVVIDDAAQKITHVTRGNDLFPITPIQVLLQLLLNLPTPVYHHHGLIFEQSGKKMSKRSSPKTVSSLKNSGYTPDEVISMAFNSKQNNDQFISL